jgi:hypothetical protein
MGAGGGIPMSRRVRLADDPLDPCPARHCMVAGAVDDAGVKRPGLLVEWRPTGSGWEGRVVYAALLRSGSWVLVEEWLPASLLSPL